MNPEHHYPESDPLKNEQTHGTFNDLQDHSEAGLVKRAVAKYLFSRNPDQSVKVYTALGMPVLRKVIMGTIGQLVPRGPISNYRTNPNKSMIERSMRFAVGGSVFNEAVHTGGAGLSVYSFIDALAEGHNPTAAGIAVGLNTALVGLQRYNRARMTQRVNQELAKGERFDSTYKNWLGIDGRAISNYENQAQDQIDAIDDGQDIEQLDVEKSEVG